MIRNILIASSDQKARFYLQQDIFKNTTHNLHFIDIKDRSLTGFSPDIIFIDLDKRTNTLSHISKIKSVFLYIPIIGILDPSDTSLIFSSLKVGITGFLEKNASKKVLIWTLDFALSGGTPMSKRIAKCILSSFQFPQQPLLSQRENEVFQLLANKKSYIEIANDLSLSINTIKTHTKHIYDKLQVQSKSELSKRYQNSSFPNNLYY